jgi:hypothetical protein
MRASGKTLLQIATELHVSKSSVSLWVRDVPYEATPRRTGPNKRRQPLRERRLREIAEFDLAGRERIGVLEEEAFLTAGVALYAGEGSKRDGSLIFANTDPAMIRFFCAWLRYFFDPEETRLRVRIYLHEGLDLDAAEQQWSAVTSIPRHQFQAAHRVPANASRRKNRHEFGCCYVGYASSSVHRAIMGLVRALLSSEAIPG